MSHESADPQWLDQEHPHEAEVAATQLCSLLTLIGPSPKRVLDLGCGSGRVLIPLIQDGHDVTGIDRDARALETCRAVVGKQSSPALIHADFQKAAWPEGPYDAVLCLGNTFMTIVSVQDAVDLLCRAREAVISGGFVIVDDLPGEFWPELTEGNWQSGIAEDGTAQMVWDPRDSVFALRTGEAVDPECWTFKRSEPLFRLWPLGALALACQSAGLSEPVVHPGLLVMSPVNGRPLR